MTVNLYEYDDYSFYLREALVAPRMGKKPPSLSVWARRLGYRSPRSVAMVLNKYRVPTSKMILRLSELLGHSDAEHRYFELLVQLDRARGNGIEEKSIEVKLRALRPGSHQKELREEQFRYVAEWYHLVVKQLAATPEFREDPKWVCERLRGKITTEDFYRALSTLQRLQLLKRDPKSRRLREATPARTTEDVPSVAIRQHHQQMLMRAIEALDEQDVHEREITSKTLRIDPNKIESAKKDLRRFKQMFEKKYEKADSNAVYQLNLQLFAHTRK